MRLSVLLAALLSTPAATAQEEATVAGDFFGESPPILTVSRMTKPMLESPASVSVIDREMIEASGVRELADLFRLVPGFIVGYHSGHAPAVSYLGLGQEFSRQLQVLVDGRSVFIPSFGGVPWSNLPLLLEDIERIEVIRGPNAVTYGANAFLATINIITRHAAEDLGSKLTVTASDNAHPDVKDAYLRIANQHDDLDWRLSMGSISDDGFAAINDSRRVDKLNLRVDLAARSNQFWTFQAGTSDSTVGRGFPPEDGDDTDIERDEEASNSYASLQWEGDWQSSNTIVRLMHTRQEVTDNYDPGPITVSGIPGITTYIDFDRISERSELELVHTDEVGEQLRLVYGGGLRRDRVKSLFLLNRDDYQEVDSERLFGSIEWRFAGDWLLDLGVMLEDSSLTSRESSPRVSLIRKFDNRHALRFVYSAAKRNPILWEAEGETEFSGTVPLFGEVVLPTWSGNEDIEPEGIESREIGLHSQFAGGIETDIKLFALEITDHILVTQEAVDLGFPLGVVAVETSTNGESTDISGIEFALGYRPHARLRLDAGFSVVDADSDVEEFEDSIPDYTAFAAALYRFAGGHEVSANYYYLDAVSWLDSSAHIGPARRLDLRYAYRMANGFSVEVIGQNLLEDYEDYEHENLHEQLYYLRLSGGF